VSPASGTCAGLGDLDDRFHSEDPSERNFGTVIAYGGPGDDTLAAENNVNALYGDDGNDSLARPSPSTPRTTCSRVATATTA
jgi:hypothetical protein